jgi:DNA mismatch repair protein MSH6
VAESSFGTHVANLAGVPLSVVERAEVVSKDFAALFQKKLAARRTSSLPLVAQADFAYMMKAVNGDGLVNAGKMRQSLEIIRKAVGRYITE